MKKVIDFLKENCLTTLATCSDDKPRASSAEYYLVGDAIIFGTDPRSIKAQNLKHNKRISMSVNAMPKFLTIDGVVTQPTQAEIDGYTKILFEHHPEFKALREQHVMESILFKVVIETAYYCDFTNGIAPAEIFKA
jgi:uncharacterized pyridoxamine 5'-phosphate oxidase family protein